MNQCGLALQAISKAVRSLVQTSRIDNERLILTSYSFLHQLPGDGEIYLVFAIRDSCIEEIRGCQFSVELADPDLLTKIESIIRACHNKKCCDCEYKK